MHEKSKVMSIAYQSNNAREQSIWLIQQDEKAITFPLDQLFIKLPTILKLDEHHDPVKRTNYESIANNQGT